MAPTHKDYTTKLALAKISTIYFEDENGETLLGQKNYMN